MLRLLRTADSLLRRTNIDAEGIRQRLMLVDQECENFMIKLDNRRKNIFMAVSFFNLAETVNKPMKIVYFISLSTSYFISHKNKLKEKCYGRKCGVSERKHCSLVIINSKLIHID